MQIKHYKDPKEGRYIIKFIVQIKLHLCPTGLGTADESK